MFSAWLALSKKMYSRARNSSGNSAPCNYQALPQELKAMIWSMLNLSERMVGMEVDHEHRTMLRGNYYWIKAFNLHFPQHFGTTMTAFEKCADIEAEAFWINAFMGLHFLSKRVPGYLFDINALNNMSVTAIKFLFENFIQNEDRSDFQQKFMQLAFGEFRRRDIMEYLIAEGLPPNATIDAIPLLEYAIKYGNAHVVRTLLKIRTDSKTFHSGNFSPLEDAISYGNALTIDLLISHDKTLLDKKRHSASMLHELIRAEIDLYLKLELIRRFVTLQPTLLNQHSKNGYTPLMMACTLNSYHMAECLIQLGADVHTKVRIFSEKHADNFERDAFYCAVFPEQSAVELYDKNKRLATHHKIKSLFDLLKENHANPHLKYKDKTVMHYLCDRLHRKQYTSTKLDKLIACDPTLLEAKDDNGNTPLAYSLTLEQRNYLYVTRLLLKKGANPNIAVKYSHGYTTPLYYVAARGDTELERRLIMKKGVSMKATLTELKSDYADIKERFAKYKKDDFFMAQHRTAKMLNAAKINQYAKYVNSDNALNQTDVIDAIEKVRESHFNRSLCLFTPNEKEVIKAMPKLQAIYENAKK